MEQTITVRFVNTASVKSGANAGNPYWIVEDMDGKKWSVFDKELADTFQPAKTYNIRTEQNGKYLNLKENLGESGNEAITEKVEKNKPTTLSVEANTSLIIHRKERQNSYEYGKAGNRVKLYFQDIKDLQKQVKEIQDAGFGLDDVSVEE